MVKTTDQSSCPSGFVQHHCDAHATPRERSGGDKACNMPVYISSDISHEFEDLSVGCRDHSLQLIWSRTSVTARKKLIPLACDSYTINVESFGRNGVWIGGDIKQSYRKCHWISFEGNSQASWQPFSVWIDRNARMKGVTRTKYLTERFPDTNTSVTGIRFCPVDAVVLYADGDEMQLSSEQIEGTETSGRDVSWYKHAPKWDSTWYEAPSSVNAEAVFDLDLENIAEHFENQYGDIFG